MAGMIMLRIIVPMIVLPMILNHVRLKSLRLPPTSPNVSGLVVMFALTRNRRIAVFKNCTQKTTLVVRSNLFVS